MFKNPFNHLNGYSNFVEMYVTTETYRPYDQYY